MSDYTIRLTPPELRSRASEIEHNAETVRKEVDRISQEVDKLRPTFIGQAASKFMKEFDTSRTDMQEWDKIVRQFAELLKTAANNLERADRA